MAQTVFIKVTAYPPATAGKRVEREHFYTPATRASLSLSALATTVAADVVTVAADVATLVADGAAPTQAHVNTLNTDWTALSAAWTALNTAIAAATAGDLTVSFDPTTVVSVDHARAMFNAALRLLAGGSELTKGAGSSLTVANPVGG